MMKTRLLQTIFCLGWFVQVYCQYNPSGLPNSCTTTWSASEVLTGCQLGTTTGTKASASWNANFRCPTGHRVVQINGQNFFNAGDALAAVEYVCSDGSKYRFGDWYNTMYWWSSPLLTSITYVYGAESSYMYGGLAPAAIQYTDTMGWRGGQSGYSSFRHLSDIVNNCPMVGVNHFYPCCPVAQGSIIGRVQFLYSCRPCTGLDYDGACACPQNYFPQGDKCAPCPNGQTCTFQGLQCSAGFGSNGTACVRCGGSTYKVGSKCSPCPVGASCNATSFSCTAGFALNQTGTGCVACGGTTFHDGTTCASCPANATCTSTRFICNPGFYSTANRCNICPFGFYCNGSSVMTSCGLNSNTTSTGSFDASMCICNPRYYFNNGNCTICPKGNYCPGGNASQSCGPNSNTAAQGANMVSQCICNQGYFGSNGVCQVCPIGKYCSGGSGSQSCGANSNTTSLGANMVSQCICNPGYFGSNGVCKICPVGKFCPGGINSQSCGVNSNTTGLGANMVSQCICNPGFFGSNGQCESCPPNSVCTSQDFQCKTGFEPAANQTNCTECVEGTFKSVVGNSACTPCSSDALCYTNEFQCKPGFTAENNITCIGCLPGFFKNVTGNEECVLCPSGTFQSEPAQTTCVACSEYSICSAGSPSMTCITGYKLSENQQLCEKIVGSHSLSGNMWLRLWQKNPAAGMTIILSIWLTSLSIGLIAGFYSVIKEPNSPDTETYSGSVLSSRYRSMSAVSRVKSNLHLSQSDSNQSGFFPNPGSPGLGHYTVAGRLRGTTRITRQMATRGTIARRR